MDQTCVLTTNPRLKIATLPIRTVATQGTQADPVLALGTGPDGKPVCISFRHIPAGRFLMGSRGIDPDEEPVHEVAITQDFYLGVFPVTQAQFSLWTEAAAIEHSNEFADKPDHPAENMTWHQARSFCQWLMDTDAGKNVPPGYAVRLPTEAEWEYACSAWLEGSGADRENSASFRRLDYHNGDGEAALHDVGWFGYYAGGGNTQQGGAGTREVGRKEANRHRLHDMHGNVFEWCLDAYKSDAYQHRASGVQDPFVATPDGSYLDPFGIEADSAPRVFRGGS